MNKNDTSPGATTAADSARTAVSQAAASGPRAEHAVQRTPPRGSAMRLIETMDLEIGKTQLRLNAAIARREPLEVSAIRQQLARLLDRRDTALALLKSHRAWNASDRRERETGA